MATLTDPLSLIPPTTIYWDYLSTTETNTFHRFYANILVPYSMNLVSASTANVAQLIYAADQEGIMTR